VCCRFYNRLGYYRAHQRKGKETNFKKFLKADADVVSALTRLGIGDEPSTDILNLYEKFL